MWVVLSEEVLDPVGGAGLLEEVRNWAGVEGLYAQPIFCLLFAFYVWPRCDFSASCSWYHAIPDILDIYPSGTLSPEAAFSHGVTYSTQLIYTTRLCIL